VYVDAGGGGGGSGLQNVATASREIGSGIGDWTEHEDGENEVSSREECDSGLGVADGVDPVSGLCRPIRYEVEDGFGIFWTVDRSGARIPDSSDNLASDGVGDC
jgi:hypothetical protein